VFGLKTWGRDLKQQQISTKTPWYHKPEDSILTDPEISSKILNSSYIVFFNTQNAGIHSIHTKLGTDCISVKPQLHENNFHSSGP
jgi:hypothetical protein